MLWRRANVLVRGQESSAGLLGDLVLGPGAGAGRNRLLDPNLPRLVDELWIGVSEVRIDPEGQLLIETVAGMRSSEDDAR